MPTIHLPIVRTKAPACNKGRIIRQKRPLQPKHVWAIRVRLEIADNVRDLPLRGRHLNGGFRFVGSYRTVSNPAKSSHMAISRRGFALRSIPVIALLAVRSQKRTWAS